MLSGVTGDWFAFYPNRPLGMYSKNMRHILNFVTNSQSPIKLTNAILIHVRSHCYLSLSFSLSLSLSLSLCVYVCVCVCLCVCVCVCVCVPHTVFTLSV